MPGPIHVPCLKITQKRLNKYCRHFFGDLHWIWKSSRNVLFEFFRQKQFCLCSKMKYFLTNINFIWFSWKKIWIFQQKWTKFKCQNRFKFSNIWPFIPKLRLQFLMLFLALKFKLNFGLIFKYSEYFLLITFKQILN